MQRTNIWGVGRMRRNIQRNKLSALELRTQQVIVEDMISKRVGKVAIKVSPDEAIFCSICSMRLKPCDKSSTIFLEY